MHPDEQLMLQVKSGNLRQMSELFQRYHVKIFNFFLKMQIDRSLSEDLTQNTFERVIKYRNSFKEDYQFKSWIYKIASNVRYDHFRLNKIKLDDGAELEKSTKLQHDPFQITPQQELEDCLNKAMKKLNEEQQKIIYLTKYENMKYAEVAHVLGFSESNVKVKIHRAIKDLRNIYFEIHNHELGK